MLLQSLQNVARAAEEREIFNVYKPVAYGTFFHLREATCHLNVSIKLSFRQEILTTADVESWVFEIKHNLLRKLQIHCLRVVDE